MAETWTPRIPLPQWSDQNVDGPSMTDFDTAFSNINSMAAYDDGVNYTPLPTTNLVAGRYARLTNTDSSYTLYRRSASAWEYVGGPVAPVAQRIAALNSQAATATAFTTEPTLGTAGLAITFGGDLATAGLVRSASYLASAPAGDTLSATTTGRAYVKTQAAGDLGLVLRAHASTASYLLDVREQGGSDVLTVDSMGRLQARVPSAFGGSSITPASIMAISPTTNSSDGVTNGLLLTGQPSMPTRTLLTALSAPGDTQTIAKWSSSGITMGKLPWGASGTTDGQLGLYADSTYFRVGGINQPGGNQTWLMVEKALASAPTDPSQDIPVFAITATGTSIYQPGYFSQEYATSNPTVTNLTLYRFNDASASGRFFEMYQATRVNPTTVTFKFAADMNGDGRMRSALMWRGSNPPSRDVRQSIKHNSTKTWAVPGDGPDVGQEVAGAGGSHTYNGFPTMTTHSFGGCDLDITVTTELMLDDSAFSSEDGQVYGLECFISINGGSFTSLLKQENAQAVSGPGIRQAGDLMVCRYRALGLGNGATFKIRLVMSTGSPNPNLFLRKYDLIAEEVSFEQYTAV
jgi:hypothetical protein